MISQVLAWANIKNKPTTRDGYGITDVPKADGTGASEAATLRAELQGLGV